MELQLTSLGLDPDDPQLQRVKAILKKATPRPVREGEANGHVILVLDEQGEFHRVDGASLAIIAHRERTQHLVWGAVDSGDNRAAWTQFGILEAAPTTESLPGDGGGIVFQPFVDLQTPDTKLRQRLHVVLADSPRRPFNGDSQALNAPRAFLKIAAQTAAANLMTSQACDVLRELSGAQTDLCRHRLVPLGIFNPQDTYWDLGRLHPEAGVKLMGFRFKPNEVEIDKGTGLYKLREEVITSVDEDVDKGAWATWRFHPYPRAIASRSGMTIAPAARLFDALDEME